MYGHERSLVNKMSGRPFVLLGVNNDGKIETVKEAIKENKLNWRSWYDGQGGPIVKKFGIKAFPTLFFIDHTGVIRYKNVRDPNKMDAVLEQMVSLAENSTPTFREFIDVSGKHKTTAMYVAYEDGKVVLQKENEKEVKVPWNRLSAADRQYIAEKRLREQGRSKHAGAAPMMNFESLHEFTDSSGKNSVKGVYIALEDGKVILWNSEGKEISVAWRDLSKDSRDFIQKEIKRYKEGNKS